jgi:hypothetical protein
MRLQDKINKAVEAKTGYDVPELGDKRTLSKKEILESLKNAKRWHEDHAQDCMQAIDIIIGQEFTLDERIAGA